MSVVVTLALVGGVAYVAADWLGVWDPVTVRSERASSADTFVVKPAANKSKTPAAAEKKPFRKLANETCLAYAPTYIPGATAARARAAAREFAILARKLGRINPPPRLRRDYRAMLSSLNDVAAAKRREADVFAQGAGGQAAYSASVDATHASQRARSQARRMHLRWCVNSIFAIS